MQPFKESEHLILISGLDADPIIPHGKLPNPGLKNRAYVDAGRVAAPGLDRV